MQALVHFPFVPHCSRPRSGLPLCLQARSAPGLHSCFGGQEPVATQTNLPDWHSLVPGQFLAVVQLVRGDVPSSTLPSQLLSWPSQTSAEDWIFWTQLPQVPLAQVRLPSLQTPSLPVSQGWEMAVVHSQTAEQVLQVPLVQVLVPDLLPDAPQGVEHWRVSFSVHLPHCDSLEQVLHLPAVQVRVPGLPQVAVQLCGVTLLSIVPSQLSSWLLQVDGCFGPGVQVPHFPFVHFWVPLEQAPGRLEVQDWVVPFVHWVVVGVGVKTIEVTFLTSKDVPSIAHLSSRNSTLSSFPNANPIRPELETDT